MFGVQINIFRSFFPWICVRCAVEIVSLIVLQRLPYALPYQHYKDERPWVTERRRK
jgi:hypothetical protein